MIRDSPTAGSLPTPAASRRWLSKLEGRRARWVGVWIERSLPSRHFNDAAPSHKRRGAIAGLEVSDHQRTDGRALASGRREGFARQRRRRDLCKPTF